MTLTQTIMHGDMHNHGVLVEIGHWLSSPVHGLGTVVAIAAIGFIGYRIFRKKA